MKAMFALASEWPIFVLVRPLSQFSMTRLATAAVIMAVSAMSMMAAEKPYPEWFDPKKNVLPPEAERILDSGEFRLLSLKPELPTPKQTQRSAAEKLFHGYTILGTTTIKDHSERTKLLRALRDGLASSSGVSAYCFKPRHGIRATLGGKTVDVVICFECLRVEVHTPAEVYLLTSTSPQPVFDRALRRARVPLSNRD